MCCQHIYATTGTFEIFCLYLMMFPREKKQCLCVLVLFTILFFGVDNSFIVALKAGEQ